jgi:transcription initiation factor IIE alpha subunit
MSLVLARPSGSLEVNSEQKTFVCPRCHVEMSYRVEEFLEVHERLCARLYAS